MKALVTGSAGFVGSAFVKQLLEDGHDVHGVDIQPRITSDYDYVNDDIRRYMTRKGPDKNDLIIHCAATVGGRLTIDGDPLAVATNLSIDAEFFNWIARSKNHDQHIVYFSSPAAYPISMQRRNGHQLLSEHLLAFRTTIDVWGVPDQSYGFAKLAGEFLAQKAVNDYQCDVVIYRPFGGYGEGQSLDYPFPSIMRRVVNRDNPIMVWGSGEQLRDFIHIDDIVDAVLLTYNKLPPGEVLNLGTGRGVSFIELARTALLMTGDEAIIKNDSTRPEGVFARVADVTKMKNWYKPQISLEAGVNRMLKHMRNTLVLT